MTIKQKIRTFILQKLPFLYSLAIKPLELVRVDIFEIMHCDFGDAVGHNQQIQKYIANSVPVEKRLPHLLLYTSSLGSGGAERQWCYLALELVKRGYLVTLLADYLENEHGHYLPLLQETSVRVVSMESWKTSKISIEFYKQCFSTYALRNLHNFENLFAMVNQLKPSHMLCQLDNPNILGSAVAHCFPIEKMLLSFRNVNPSNFPNFYEEWMLSAYVELAKSERVVWTGNSQYGNADYARWIGMDEKRIHTIHNAIDIPQECTEQSKNDLRKALGIAQDAPVLLGVFRLSAEKNVPLFLQVVKALQKELPELVVLHAGHGSAEEDTKQRIAELGLDSTVKLLGRRNDVTKLMQISDVLLLTSLYEGLPNVLLEAQAARLPVVATRVGGVPDAVIEGITGFVAESGDAVSLTKHCLALLRDSSLRASMGQAGHAFIQENFSHKALGDKTLKVLDLPLMAEHKGLTHPPMVAEGAYPAELTRISIVQKYLDTLSQPCVVFLERYELAAFIEVPEESIFVCPDAPAHDDSALAFDWCQEQDWQPLQSALPKGGLAVFMENMFKYKHYCQRLTTCGVEQCIFPHRQSVYCLPAVFPSLWYRICMGMRKLVN